MDSVVPTPIPAVTTFRHAGQKFRALRYRLRDLGHKAVYGQRSVAKCLDIQQALVSRAEVHGRAGLKTASLLSGWSRIMVQKLPSAERGFYLLSPEEFLSGE